MTSIAWEHPGSLIPRLVAELLAADVGSLLDIGGGGETVGYGAWPAGIRLHALDKFDHGPKPGVTVGDGCDAAAIFGAKSFEVVMMCEVIEHLEKADGFRLLDAAEAVARRLVIGTTPHGFQVQDPALHPEAPWANNPYQKHLSGWSIPDFESRGYMVICNGGPTAAPLVFYKVIA